MPKAAGLINPAVHPALPLLWQVTAGSAITLEFFVFLFFYVRVSQKSSEIPAVYC